MNGKEAFYKRKTPGLANREVRAKLKTHESRTKRDDLLASKRRIPLSVIQEQDKSSPCPSPMAKKTISKQAQSDLRLQKLKEWQKTREEAKKAKQAQKKPFGNGSLSSTSGKPNIFVAKPWKVASPGAKAKAKESKAAKPMTNSFTKPKSVSKPPAKTVSKPVSKAATIPSRPASAKSARPSTLAPKSKSSTAPKIGTVKTRQAVKPQASKPSSVSKEPKKPTKPASMNKESTKQPVKPKEVAKPVNKRPVTRSMTKSAVSKVQAVSKKSCSTKAPKGTKQSTKSTTKPPERSVTASRRTKDITKDTEQAMDITVEINNPSANEEESLPTPVTPPRSNRYDPVRPSPLLRSTSARRETQLFSGPRAVTDPAWIPGQVNNESFVQPNFDDAFGSFSPFKFGGSSNAFQFTFRKELSFSNDSLEEEMATDHSGTQHVTVIPDARIVRKSLGSVRKSSPMRSVSVNHESSAVIVEVVHSTEQEESMDTEEPVEATKEPEIDFGYFRKLHSDVTTTLTTLSEVWEGKISGLEEEQPDGSNDEGYALGQVRTTVCQARLLMRQKLKQYSGLVDTAEAQSGERKTTADDLQGFWDMVYCQVEDVYQKFHGLEALERNGWTKEPTPKKKRATKKRTVKKTTAAPSAEETERQKAAREKREAQRNKLKELRMAAKRAREEEAVPEQESIVSTPKKSKLDQSPPATGSAYKNGKRRSLRVRHQRSIFSPCSTERPSCPRAISDIPIAPLISFD